MSKVRSDNISNRANDGAPKLTFGAEVPVGYGITGAGFINVSGVSTFSGNVTIGGTLTYEDVTNVDSVGIITARSGIEFGILGVGGTITAAGDAEFAGIVTAASFVGGTITATGQAEFAGVVGAGLSVSGISTFSGAQKVSTGAEKVHRQSGNTVTLTFNSTSSSNVGYTTNPDGNITLAVTDIPTSSDFDDHSITFALIVNSTGTARTCTAVTLNGVSKTIRWAGGSLGSALSGVTTTTGHSIFNFTGINTVGSASTTDNYEVFGIVSGGFF